TSSAMTRSSIRSPAMAVSRSGCRSGAERRPGADRGATQPCGKSRLLGKAAPLCHNGRQHRCCVRRGYSQNPPAAKKKREDFVAHIRVLATGLEFPEGPVVLPDGSVVLVEIRGQRLTRVYPDGRKDVVAQMPGGPNGAALGPDGKMYVCNNGGFTWIPTRNTIMPGPQPDDYRGGSIQR